MKNEPVALTQADILGILQDANSVPCGQPIFNSSEEYNKLKAIIESAIRYTHPAKTLTDEEIDLTGKNNEGVLRLFYMIKGDVTGLQFKEALRDFARAILKKANNG